MILRIQCVRVCSRGTTEPPWLSNWSDSPIKLCASASLYAASRRSLRDSLARVERVRCRAKNRYFVVARDVTERPTNEDHQQEAVVARLKFAGLSPREQEVLRMVAEGQTNKAIARRMSLSEKTVERHRSRGMRKLKLGNVPDLVRLMLLADI